MNKSDKILLKALKFFADNTRTKVNLAKEEDKINYNSYVSDDSERTLQKQGYIQPNGKTRYIITDKGREELRKLEQIFLKDKTFYIAIAGLIISIVSFLKVYDYFDLINFIKNIFIKG